MMTSSSRNKCLDTIWFDFRFFDLQIERHFLQDFDFVFCLNHSLEEVSSIYKSRLSERCLRKALWLAERTSVRAASISGPMWRRYALHRTWQPFLWCICCTFVSTWIWNFRIWNIQTSWRGFQIDVFAFSCTSSSSKIWKPAWTVTKSSLIRIVIF